MSTLELERDAIRLIKSYGLSAVLSQYAEICTKQTQSIQIPSSDGLGPVAERDHRMSLEVISNLLLTAAHQAQKPPRTSTSKGVALIQK